jgi:hypothetical protein
MLQEINRGLEAVTYATAGESIVKEKTIKQILGSVFKAKGYNVKYLYGGDAFFNMEDFFSNGYDIVDKKIHTKEIT